MIKRERRRDIRKKELRCLGSKGGNRGFCIALQGLAALDERTIWCDTDVRVPFTKRPGMGTIPRSPLTSLHAAEPKQVGL